MSEFTDQLAADVDTVFLNPDEFGKGITHHPQGGAGVPVTANWLQDSSSGDSEDNDRKGTVSVNASMALTQRDYWTIAGEEWATDSWHEVDGMKHVKVSRADPNRRTKRQGKR